MTQHLYKEEDARYTPKAIALDEEANALLQPLFKKYVEMGYSPRDIGHVLAGTVIDIEMETVLTYGQRRLLENHS